MRGQLDHALLTCGRGRFPLGDQRPHPADPWRFPKHWGVCYHSGGSIFHSFFHSSIHGAANKQNKEFHFRVVEKGLLLVWLRPHLVSSNPVTFWVGRGNLLRSVFPGDILTGLRAFLARCLLPCGRMRRFFGTFSFRDVYHVVTIFWSVTPSVPGGGASGGCVYFRLLLVAACRGTSP